MPGELDLMPVCRESGLPKACGFRVRTNHAANCSDRMRRNVLQQQFVDAIGRLISREMADAG